jgi:hypothetical protein
VVAPERGEDLAAALVATINAGRAELFPGDGGKLAPVVAMATTADLPAGATDQLARRLGATMRTAKQTDGGGYVIWRG